MKRNSTDKNQYLAEYYQKNKEAIRARIKAYYHKNKKVIAIRQAKYHSKYDKTPMGKASKKKAFYVWWARHPQYFKTYATNYRKKNFLAMRAYRRSYSKRPRVKIRLNLARRIWKVLNGTSKSQKTMDLVGCTIQDFMAHLESKFQKGMTWDNYGCGKGKWNMDHIVPCCVFDLTDPVEQKQCFHYTNLQPLWHIDNISKNRRTTPYPPRHHNTFGGLSRAK